MTIISMLTYGAYAALVPIVWMLICNERTFRARSAILERVRGLNHPEAALVLLADMRMASYRDHQWRLVTFRDPRKLYSARIHHLMGWPLVYKARWKPARGAGEGPNA